MFKLPDLKYKYNALEPYIDEVTMKVHHDLHHKAYIDKLNVALEKYPDLSKKSIEELLSDLNSIPEDIKTAVRNHGGGHYNHSFFWKILSPNSGGEPTRQLGDSINKSFGSFKEFKGKFTTAGLNRFGSGWIWLTKSGGELVIESTPNQDTPLSESKHAILGLDVWEHAYYLKFQNRRADYINSWWNVVDWIEIEKNFTTIT